MNKKNLSELRRRYTKDGLPDDGLPDDPLILLSGWLDQAVRADVMEPNAMSLATTGPEGNPDVRTVLLKGITARGILFFTNYRSAKGEQLSAHPYAACCFWWPELERQIRLAGHVQKLPAEESRDYFASRPRESRIGAWASVQSQPVSNRAELDNRFREYEKKFEGEEIPMPDYWGGFEIQAERIEYWQGRPGRLHDRILYTRSGDEWKQNRLSP
ncbi:MAG: pyridoxamine 5'-phosphate oxidase [Balneolaceae bacterium]